MICNHENRVLAENAVTVSEASRLVASGTGKPVHNSTIWRWATIGFRVRGGERVHLEAARIFGRWVTSREALRRFLDRIHQQPEQPFLIESAKTTTATKSKRTKGEVHNAR